MPKPSLPPTPPGRFAARLREAIADAGWPARGSQKRLADHFGITPESVNGWFSGKHMPEVDRIQEIARLLGCDFDWLWKGAPKAIKVAEPAARYGDPEDMDEVRIWDAEAAAGVGFDNSHAKPIGTLLFRHRSLRKKSIRAPEAIYVSGHSMVPRLRDGDTIIFDTTDTLPIKSGKVYVITLDGEACVKRLHAEPGGVIRIASDNRSDPQFQDMLIEPDGDRLQVHGRVRWVGSWED